MRKDHKGIGAWVDLPDPLLQKHVEDLYRGIRKAGGNPMQISAPEYNGAVVRAAIELGWCGGPAPVAEMKPGAVTWIARQINDVLAEALEIPPE
jgi:hypothetical protein